MLKQQQMTSWTSFFAKIPFLYPLKTHKKKQFSYKFWNGLQQVFKNFNFLKQGFFTADPNFHLFLNYKTQYYQPVQ